MERRKKAEDSGGNPALCRVEVTRPNPDSLIDELIKATNLEQSVLESVESKLNECFAAALFLRLLYGREKSLMSRAKRRCKEDVL